MAFSRTVPSASSIPHADNAQARGRHSVPTTMQPLVSSASPLPGSHRAPSITIDHPLDPETRTFYVNQQRIHEEERELWDKQRAIWNKDRADLWKRITQLEATVSTLQGAGLVASPKSSVVQSNDRFCSYPPQPPPQPRQPSTGSERPVWEGPESQPTRTFSEPINAFGTKSFGPLSSIPEHAEVGPGKSVGFQLTNSELRKTRSDSATIAAGGIPGAAIHPDYDSIIFKASSAPTEITRPGGDPRLSIDSVSPLTLPPRPEPSVRPKLLDLPTANRYSEQLYSEDAGHTPLARIEGDESIPSSRGDPMKTEVERPPFEPRPTQMRPPNERADSYFPPPDETVKEPETQQVDEDPALKGPLTLSSGNKLESFSLDEVNSKLEKLMDKDGSQSSKKGSSHARGASEEIPKLRMKRSTNFGAPFGEAGIGRGVD